ncbi:beta family protein [Gordonia effusa]|nr:hypothetical protein [Gordonia effusa]
MPKIYRPFLLARAGELAGLTRLGANVRTSMLPVFRIPERAWDYENGRYYKTHEEHLSGVPEKLASAWTGGRGYLDLSLLDRNDAVQGKHPLTYLIDEAGTHSLELTPLISSISTQGHLAATSTAHRTFGRGAAIQLPQADWTTINPSALSTLMSTVSLTPGEIDVIVDFETSDGPVTEVAAIAELASLRSLGEFRSVTVGGAGFPDLAGVPQGTTEYPRKEWNVYTSIQNKLFQQGIVTPDFFDHAIQNPDLIELGVDPRFLSISATLRYTVAEKWLVAKGELFKGRGTSSKGGAALIPPLEALVRHPEYATPTRSLADDWIDAVIAKSETPGAPQKWREWATVRHAEVTVFQLSSLP